MKLKTNKELMEEQAKRHAAIRVMLSSPGGKALLEELEIIFDGSLVAQSEGRGMDVNQTLVNLGGREVLVHLKTIRDREE